MADGFVQQVHNWRSSYQFTGTSSFILEKKLKALKTDLKKWNDEEFEHVVQNIVCYKTCKCWIPLRNIEPYWMKRK